MITSWKACENRDFWASRVPWRDLYQLINQLSKFVGICKPFMKYNHSLIMKFVTK